MPQFRLTFNVATICLAIVFTLLWLGPMSARALALQCGDTITADATLTADLGPCGGGIVIDAADTPVTLDLNGHKIFGGGTGVTVLSARPGVIIKGAGSINGFSQGIQLTFAIGGVLIYDITFGGNETAIEIGAFRSGSTRILNNVITGGSTAGSEGVGIAIQMVSGAGGTIIYQNTISGQTQAVMVHNDPSIISTVVDENLITRNETGISIGSPGFECFRFRGNRVIANHGTGIMLGHTQFGYANPEIALLPTGSCDAIVEDNTVASNGGSGITAESWSFYGPELSDNIVYSNKKNGISINAESPFALPAQLSGNRLSNNGTDLFWDQIGPPPCLIQDIYTTSSPQPMPPCN
jgi:hypothetical protein